MGSRRVLELTWVKASCARHRHYGAMDDADRDILAVAREVVRSFGPDTPGIMERRAKAHLHANEWEGAEFWQHVADIARIVLGSRSGTFSRSPGLRDVADRRDWNGAKSV